MRQAFFFRLLLIAMGVIASAGVALAQTDTSEGDYPSAVYLGTNYEHVDVSTGRVYLNIPLLTDHSQRGDLNFSYSVFWSGMGAWVDTCYKSYKELCYFWPSVQGSYPQSNIKYWGPTPIMDGGLEISAETINSASIVGSDGSSHVAMEPTSLPNYFETPDGSGMHVACPLPCEGPAYPLTDRKGRVFSVSLNPYVWSVSDRNGNKMTMLPSDTIYGPTFGPNEFWRIDTLGNPASWTMTDTVGRTWSYAPASSTSGCPSSVGADHASIWTTPGQNGGTRTFEFCFSAFTISASFLDQYGSTDPYSAAPDLLSAIVLPDGTNWQFQYTDDFGDLTKLILPTGGSITYQYATTSSCGATENCPPYGRVLTSRTVSDGTNSKTWNYRLALYQPGSSFTATDPLGNDTVYILAEPQTTQYYAGSASSGTLLETVNKSHTVVAGVPFPYSTTTVWPNGQTHSSTLTYDPGFTYSGGLLTGFYGLVTSQTDTNYDGSTLRQTNTEYESQVNPSYLTANLLDFPYQVGVTGSGGTASVSCFSGTAQSCTGYSYDGVGNETSVTQSLNTGPSPVTEYGHNGYGMLTSMTDPRNSTTNYKYDSSGVCVNEIDYPTPSSGVSQIEHFTCDPNTEQITQHTDRNGNPTNYSYDDMLRSLTISYPDTGETTYSYPNPNEVDFSQKIDNAGHNLTGSSKFDGLGRIVQQIVSNGETIPFDQTDTCYDSDGRVGFTSYPYQGSGLSGSPCPSSKPGDSFGLDALSRITSVTHSDGSVASLNYSNFPCTTVTDEQSKSKQDCTDGLGRLTSVIEDPGSSPHLNYATTYSYDVFNDLTGVTQAASRQRTFVYDSLSRLSSSTNPEANWSAANQAYVATTYTYDADGNLINKTEPAQNQQSTSTVTLTYCYDALNRMTAKGYTPQTCANGLLPTPVATYVYDGGPLPSGCSVGSFSYGLAIGNRTAMCDAAGSEAWSYNIVSGMGSRIADQRTTNALTKTAVYQNNLLGSPISVQYPSGNTVNYAYNLGNRPISASDSTNTYLNVAHYIANGALCWAVLGGVTTTSETFNNRLQPNGMQAINSVLAYPSNCTTGLGQTGNLLDLTYNFNLGSDNGSVMSIANNRDPTRSQSFLYDALNRTSQATASTFAVSPAHCWGESYQYDNQTSGGAWGNLTSIGVASSSYNGCTQESLSVTATAQNRNTTDTFDTAGNLTNILGTGGGIFTYDAENHLTQAAVNSTAGYVYDGDGKRVEKASGGTAYKLYWYGMDGSILDETDQTGSTTNSNFNEYVFFGGKRIAQRTIN
jgi:YD repeat-containing protein